MKMMVCVYILFKILLFVYKKIQFHKFFLPQNLGITKFFSLKYQFHEKKFVYKKISCLFIFFQREERSVNLSSNYQQKKNFLNITKLLKILSTCPGFGLRLRTGHIIKSKILKMISNCFAVMYKLTMKMKV